MLKNVIKCIDSVCECAMLIHTYIHTYIIHTYIHTGLTPKITTYYIREEVCLLFKHISFLYTSFRKGGYNLGGGLSG